jgi:hypothetical protein
MAFAHVACVGVHVVKGFYDLIGPEGEIILPLTWEKVIRPNMAISMRLWPFDRHPPPRLRDRKPFQPILDTASGTAECKKQRATRPGNSASKEEQRSPVPAPAHDGRTRKEKHTHARMHRSDANGKPRN